MEEPTELIPESIVKGIDTSGIKGVVYIPSFCDARRKSQLGKAGVQHFYLFNKNKQDSVGADRVGKRVRRY
jgi:hypothetical protein